MEVAPPCTSSFSRSSVFSTDDLVLHRGVGISEATVRVRVNIEITPFQTRPNVDVTLTDPDGLEVAATSLVEPMSWKLEFTLHVRGRQDPAGSYHLEARLYYPEGPEMEPVSFDFTIPAAE